MITDLGRELKMSISISPIQNNASTSFLKKYGDNLQLKSNQLQKKINQIEKNPSLSKDKKREQLKVLEQQQEELTREMQMQQQKEDEKVQIKQDMKIHKKHVEDLDAYGVDPKSVQMDELMNRILENKSNAPEDLDTDAIKEEAQQETDLKAEQESNSKVIDSPLTDNTTQEIVMNEKQKDEFDKLQQRKKESLEQEGIYVDELV